MGSSIRGRKICRRKFRGANALMCSPGVDREKSCERKGAGEGEKGGAPSCLQEDGSRRKRAESRVSRVHWEEWAAFLTPDIIVSFRRFLFLSRLANLDFFFFFFLIRQNVSTCEITWKSGSIKISSKSNNFHRRESSYQVSPFYV